MVRALTAPLSCADFSLATIVGRLHQHRPSLLPESQLQRPPAHASQGMAQCCFTRGLDPWRQWLYLRMARSSTPTATAVIRSAAHCCMDQAVVAVAATQAGRRDDTTWLMAASPNQGTKAAAHSDASHGEIKNRNVCQLFLARILVTVRWHWFGVCHKSEGRSLLFIVELQSWIDPRDTC